MNELPLNGCTSEPLMGYLKALGVLRLVSEQVDPDVLGNWNHGVFVLTTRLDSGELTSFFRDDYKPTPLLAPWNGGSGFYLKLDLDRFLDTQGNQIGFKSRDVVDAINAIESSDVARLSQYRQQIKQTKHALGVIAVRANLSLALEDAIQKWCQATTKSAQKKVKEEATKILNVMLLFRSGDEVFSINKAAKDEFISDLRGKVLTDDGISWLDAALAMRTGQKKNRVEAPVLGSGGNIGNSDFSARFAQLLPKVMSLQGHEPIPDGSIDLLKAALNGTPAPHLQKISIDQFDPGKAGGANGTQGLEAAPLLNPWDYLLMIEGALVLAGNTSRRIGAGRSVASFPFVVDSTPAGHGSVGFDSTRGEIWLPLWSANVSFGEVELLLGEGRAEIGKRRAWSGLTFAQAVAGLGVDRGIQSFVRYEFQERFGKNYIATPVGQFNVPDRPVEGIELVRTLNDWLDSYRTACRTKKEGAKSDPPARFPTSYRRIQSDIFEYCKCGGANRLVRILAALGNAERELALGNSKPENRRVRRPLGGLPSGWLTAANDDSSEFRLARALAFLYPGVNGTNLVRRSLEPVEWDKKYSCWTWGERGGHVVWSGGDVARNLGALLIRRMMDAERSGEQVPPLGSPFPTRLADIANFLNGAIDDTALDELIWGLSLIERDEKWEMATFSGDVELPRAYALLKLTLLPGTLEWKPSPRGGSKLCMNRSKSRVLSAGMLVKSEPAVLARLRAGDIQAACDLAARRLCLSGFPPVGGFRADGSRRKTDWSASGVAADRLLASLLFPIPDHAIDQLADLVLRRPSMESLA